MHFSNHRYCRSAGHSQKGAVLIVGLVMLLLMTIVGLAAVRGSGLQELMAGNMRERNLAFQAAEAGLREGEAVVVNPTGLTFDGTNGLFPNLNAPNPLGLSPLSLWEDADWAARGVLTGADLAGITERPRYVIEEVPTIVPAGADGGAIDFASQLEEEATVFYRITSRGISGSGTSEAVLQSMYKP